MLIVKDLPDVSQKSARLKGREKAMKAARESEAGGGEFGNSAPKGRWWVEERVE